MVDLIGDIHGYADKLKDLLLRLGYKHKYGTYSHPERKVIYVGDYIDRGPQIRETLEIVKSMVDNENAIALMGNHEYNALCFHYNHVGGGHLRKHDIKNILQHHETLKQFQNRQKEYEDYLEWIKTLPLFYETDKFRAVHACWDNNNIDFLKENLEDNRLTDELIYKSVEKGSILHQAIEETLKGKEIKLPEGHFFIDKDGTQRTDIRMKWWENPSHITYREICVEPIDGIPEHTVAISNLKSGTFYNEKEKHIFFGHYWLKGKPYLFRDNVCCLDFSIAKGGKLVAYRYNNESYLMVDKMIYVQ